MVRTLPSTKYLRECFDYNPATGVLTWKARPLHHFKRAQDQLTWNAKHAEKTTGALDSNGYLRIRLNNRGFWAHRLIWCLHTGKWPTEIDHINGDTSDNRLGNLRAATRRQNTWNTRWATRALPRGVYPNGRRFRAAVEITGEQIHLGTFDTPKEAHAAWCAFVSKRRGEFFHP